MGSRFRRPELLELLPEGPWPRSTRAPRLSSTSFAKKSAWPRRSLDFGSRSWPIRDSTTSSA